MEHTGVGFNNIREVQEYIFDTNSQEFIFVNNLTCSSCTQYSFDLYYLVHLWGFLIHSGFHRHLISFQNAGAFHLYLQYATQEEEHSSADWQCPEAWERGGPQGTRPVVRTATDVDVTGGGRSDAEGATCKWDDSEYNAINRKCASTDGSGTRRYTEMCCRVQHRVRFRVQHMMPCAAQHGVLHRFQHWV